MKQKPVQLFISLVPLLIFSMVTASLLWSDDLFRFFIYIGLPLIIIFDFFRLKKDNK